MLISLNGGPVKKKKLSGVLSLPHFSKKEPLISQVNIGIKYDILLHAFPQLHHFLREILYSVYPHTPLQSTIKWEWIEYEQK